MAGSKPCTDHLGNSFNSITSMCKYWGIDVKVFGTRMRNNWPLDIALTKGLRGINVMDHLGNIFSTTEEMCKHWNISSKNYNHRIRMGWSIEKALTTPVNGTKLPKIDHLGNTFNTVDSMCKYWGIEYATLKRRIMSGWSLEDALTKTSQRWVCYDHKGIAYDNLDAMRDAYGVSKSTFQSRIKRGYTLEEALIGKDTRKNSKYLLDGFKDIEDMCSHYNIKVNTFKSRVGSGMSIEDALGITGRTFNRRSSAEVKEEIKVCESNGIPYATFLKRLKLGWDRDKALSTPVGGPKVSDGFGNEYSDITDLSRSYGIGMVTISDRIKRGVETPVAVVCRDNKVGLRFIGLDGKARYGLNKSVDKLYTA